MDKCRICLGNKKNLLSIFKGDNGTSFADMIISVANLKFQNLHSSIDQICRTCRKKLRELYDFKMLIERSDAAICETKNLKKLNFNNINDIKIESHTKSLIPHCEEMMRNFKVGVNKICYSDTVIKKVTTYNGELKECAQPIPVLEFLQTIKGELDDDSTFDNYDFDHYGPITDEYEDHIPDEILNQPLNERKYNKKKCMYIFHKTKRIKRDAIKFQGTPAVCIKPKYLNNIRLFKEYKHTAAYLKKVCRKKEISEICPHCGKMTKSLKTHILLHSGERTFKCDVCGKGFFLQTGLNYHMKTKHSGSKDFKCDRCVATFADNSALKSHKLCHIQEKNHICDICSKAFKRKNTLRRHLIVHNSANKTVMCGQCNMSFFDRYGLGHHMRVHTGERPYNCQICSQPYSYKHDFNRHCLKKHGVFLKRRSVYVMNEEVLQQEKLLMKDLLHRADGIVKDGEPLNPFQGPQGALAFEMALQAIQNRQVTIG